MLWSRRSKRSGKKSRNTWSQSRHWQRPGPEQRVRPQLELLEDRLTPTSWTNGDLTGVWSDPLNWSDQAVPSPGDTVVFDPTAGLYANTPCSVDQIAAAGTVEIDPNWGGTLSVNYNLAVSNNFQMANGTLAVFNGLLTMGGSASSWTGGGINFGAGSGNIENDGTLNIDTSNGNLTLYGGFGTRKLTNKGTINLAGSNTLALSYGSLLNNNGTFDITDDGNVSGGNYGELINTGTLEKTGGTGTSTICLASSGGIVVQSGTLAVGSGSSLPNTGGTFTVSAGATLDLTGGNTVGYQGTYTGSGAGTVRLGSGSLAVGSSGASFDMAGNLFQWTGGWIDVSSGGTLNNAVGSVLNLDTSKNNLVLEGNGGGPTAPGSLVNHGTISLAGSKNLYLSSWPTLTNASDGTFDFIGNADVSTSYYNGTLVNAGLLEQTGGAGTSTISSWFANSGAITVSTGTLALASSGGTNTGGTFTVSAGATLDLTGGTTVWYQGNYTGSGAGTVRLASGALAVTKSGASFALPGSLFQWTGGTIDISSTGTFTNAASGVLNLDTSTNNLVLNGNGYSASGFTNDGTIIETGGNNMYMNNWPTLTNASDGTIDIISNASIGHSYGSGTLANAGLLEKTGGSGASTISTYIVNSRAITVRTGVLTLASGGGTSTGGTFLVSAGATLDLTGGNTVSYQGSYTGSGAGTVRLGSGTLAVTNAGATFNMSRNLFQWTGGMIDLSSGGTFSNAVGSVLNLDTSVNNLVLNGAGGLTNGGTINERGGKYLYLNNATTLTNASGGTFDLLSDANISCSYYNGALVNTGTFEKTGGTGVSTMDRSFSNTGMLQVSSGMLSLSGPVTQVSSNILTAGRWIVRGTTSVPATLKIVAGGFSTIGSQAAVTLSGPNSTFTNLTSLTTIQAGGSFTLARHQSFTTTGILNNAGRITLGPGSVLTVSGSFTQGATGTLAIQVGGISQAPTFGQLVSTTGAVTLGGKLKVTSSVIPAVGDSLTVVDNEANSPVSGKFTGLAEGATFTVKRGTTVMTFQITYSGNDGDGTNNVILTRIS
jgi:hypothetical protein